MGTRGGGKILDLDNLSRYKLSETGIQKFFCQNEILFDPYPKETKLLASFVTYLEADMGVCTGGRPIPTFTNFNLRDFFFANSDFNITFGSETF